MNSHPFRRKKLHKVKGQEHLTLMLLTDPTKEAKTLRIPKWLRYPAMLLAAAAVLGILMAGARIGELENQVAVFMDSAQESADSMAEKDGRIADLEEANAQRDQQLMDLEKLAVELQERLDELEAYRADIDEKIGNTDVPTTSQAEDTDLAVEAYAAAAAGSGVGGYEETKRQSQMSMAGSFESTYSSLMKNLASSLEVVEEEQASLQEQEEQLDKLLPKWEATPSILPVRNTKITSYYGNRKNPFGGSSYEFHSGVDLKARYTEVVATAKGRVAYAGWDGARGYMVLIDHGYGYRTLYAHLSKIHVKQGQAVERGEAIAKSGSTGRSSGPHLHYEVHVNGQTTDPRNYF